jgi:hypothetical protein
MFNVISIIGKKFGKLTVVKYLEKRRSNFWYECQCDCGEILESSHRSLLKTSLLEKTCKKCKPKSDRNRSKIDYTGMNFGHLTVKDNEKIYKNHDFYILCVCDCGREKLVRIQSLLSKETKFCGDYSCKHSPYKKKIDI